MKTKKFTLKQLIPVFEGVVLTKESGDDCQHVLNHIFNTSVLVTEIPVYSIMLRHVRPEPHWLQLVRLECKILYNQYCVNTGIFDFRSKRRIHEDFVKILDRDYNEPYDIPQLVEPKG